MLIGSYRSQYKKYSTVIAALLMTFSDTSWALIRYDKIKARTRLPIAQTALSTRQPPFATLAATKHDRLIA